MYPEEIDPVRDRPVKGVATVALAQSVSNGIDIRFLKSFRSLILNQIRRRGRRFLIIVGGGKICRVYQDAAGKIVRVTNEDKDWIGIHASRTNGHLLRTIFREEANPVMIDARGKVKSLTHSVTIASGWRPGNSTDYVAMALAMDFRVPEAIVMGHPAHVYNKDPRKLANAQPFMEMTWKEYKKLVPAKWAPGASAPVDPVAARLAEKAKTQAIVIGPDLKNLQHLLEGREAKGTIIR